MTLKEFAENYYLHDSSLTKFELDADSRTLTLTIEFCFWLQGWYNKGEPKNGVIAVTFENVTLAEYEYHDSSAALENLETEIRTAQIDETGAFVIIMWEFLPELDDDVYPTIKIRAETVAVAVLERYNL